MSALRSAAGDYLAIRRAVGFKPNLRDLGSVASLLTWGDGAGEVACGRGVLATGG